MTDHLVAADAVPGVDENGYVTDPQLLEELDRPEAAGKPWEDYRNAPKRDIFDELEEDEFDRASAVLVEDFVPVALVEDEPQKGPSLHQVVYHSTLFIVLVCLVGVIWWKRRQFTAARLKAAYLIWSFINFMLLITSPTPWGEKWGGERDYHSFYPFISNRDIGGEQSGLFFDHLEQYDITEFAFYVLVPLVIWQALRLWKAGGDARL